MRLARLEERTPCLLSILQREARGEEVHNGNMKGRLINTYIDVRKYRLMRDKA